MPHQLATWLLALTHAAPVAAGVASGKAMAMNVVGAEGQLRLGASGEDRGRLLAESQEQQQQQALAQMSAREAVNGRWLEQSVDTAEIDHLSTANFALPEGLCGSAQDYLLEGETSLNQAAVKLREGNPAVSLHDCYEVGVCIIWSEDAKVHLVLYNKESFPNEVAVRQVLAQPLKEQSVDGSQHEQNKGVFQGGFQESSQQGQNIESFQKSLLAVANTSATAVTSADTSVAKAGYGTSNTSEPPLNRQMLSRGRSYVTYKTVAVLLEFLTTRNITIWAEYGTLLGAARNKGIIPHDNDLDFTAFKSDAEAMKSKTFWEGSGFEYMGHDWGFIQLKYWDSWPDGGSNESFMGRVDIFPEDLYPNVKTSFWYFRQSRTKGKLDSDPQRLERDFAETQLTQWQFGCADFSIIGPKPEWAHQFLDFRYGKDWKTSVSCKGTQHKCEMLPDREWDMHGMALPCYQRSDSEGHQDVGETERRTPAILRGSALMRRASGPARNHMRILSTLANVGV